MQYLDLHKVMETVNNTLEDRGNAIEHKRCVTPPIGCGKHIEPKDFRDRESVKEYHLSGLCQSCQDEIFGLGFDDNEEL